MKEARILRFDQMPRVDRGEGVESVPLVTTGVGATIFINGVTSFPPGASIRLHSHNTDESVTVLEGEGVFEMQKDGKLVQERVKPYDTTFVPAGVPHRFINKGSGRMRILWVYGSVNVTRTFADTGETVKQLSAEDRATRRS